MPGSSSTTSTRFTAQGLLWLIGVCRPVGWTRAVGALVPIIKPARGLTGRRSARCPGTTPAPRSTKHKRPEHGYPEEDYQRKEEYPEREKPVVTLPHDDRLGSVRRDRPAYNLVAMTAPIAVAPDRAGHPDPYYQQHQRRQCHYPTSTHPDLHFDSARLATGDQGSEQLWRGCERRTERSRRIGACRVGRPVRPG